MAVYFGRALAFDHSFSSPFVLEKPTSIALVVGSGAPISGFVSSAFHVHGIIICLIVSFPLSKLCSDYIVWKKLSRLLVQVYSKGDT